ncbi:MAG: protein-L-isoaspartate(D-aspartate) O-methyltransferase [Pseudomonadota bacterium]
MTPQRDTVVENLLDALRSGGVTRPDVLDAIATVPRDQFIDEEMADYAWDNLALPIGDEQTISQPLMVGLMTQALDVGPTDKVLEIGTGSGYQCAVLSKLARRVFSIERFENLYKKATNRFEALRLRNIVCRLDNGWRGWPEQAPFSRILVTAAAEELPQMLWQQLGEGGHMVVPIGQQGQAQDVVKISRINGTMMRELVTPAKFVPMVDEAPVKSG